MTGPRLPHLALLALALATGACTDVWARGAAHQVADGLDKIRTYQGVTVEQGLGDGAEVVRRVTYAKPWMLRVETLAPAAHAGETFAYDGDTVTLWWPKELVAVRLRGVRGSDRTAVLAHLERIARASLQRYTFEYRGEAAVIANRRTEEWRLRPAKRGPFALEHRVWNDGKTTLPLKMTFPTAIKGAPPWYAYEFKELAFDVPVAPETFTVALPENAVIFEWDLSGPGITLDEARRTMNFEVRVPTKLPKGLALARAARSTGLPLLALAYEQGATRVWLTEAKATGLAPRPLGKAVLVGGQPATLTFLGPWATVTWDQAGTALSLTGNLPFPDLLALAESVR